jgi:NADPH:quinone reductase-like Zn-dependent oxidoreductase
LALGTGNALNAPFGSLPEKKGQLLMKAYQVKQPTGTDGLFLTQMPEPQAGISDVLVRIRACSLNYRDLGILQGGYYRNDKSPVIPLSDMAGVVEAIGSGVHSFKVGDRVTASFLRDWTHDAPTDSVLRTGFGGGIDGFLRETAAIPEHCLLPIPANMSFEQAATLPCAAVTVWHAFKRAVPVAGQTLLLLGTGGVSVLGLQLGKAIGYRCIVTSSSDDKLERARRLGAQSGVDAGGP